MGEYFHISCKSKISDGSIFKQKKLMWTFKKQVTFFKNKEMNSTLERGINLDQVQNNKRIFGREKG